MNNTVLRAIIIRMQVTSARAADISAQILKHAIPEKPTWNGITNFGAADGGLAYQTRGAPYF